jgi:hypothetical protein
MYEMGEPQGAATAIPINIIHGFQLRSELRTPTLELPAPAFTLPTITYLGVPTAHASLPQSHTRELGTCLGAGRMGWWDGMAALTRVSPSWAGGGLLLLVSWVRQTVRVLVLVQRSERIDVCQGTLYQQTTKVSYRLGSTSLGNPHHPAPAGGEVRRTYFLVVVPLSHARGQVSQIFRFAQVKKHRPNGSRRLDMPQRGRDVKGGGSLFLIQGPDPVDNKRAPESHPLIISLLRGSLPAGIFQHPCMLPTASERMAAGPLLL